MANWLELQGAFNVRDVGGLPAGSAVTASGVLYRGDNVDGLTAADVAELTGRRALRAVVDLRTVSESLGAPGWVAGTAVQYSHIPLLDLSGEAMAGVGAALQSDIRAAYRQMLEAAGPAIARVVGVIVSPGHPTGPVLVHCAAGKDRTGIVVAVLLSAVGVADDVVLADYMATADRIEAVRAALQRRPVYRPAPGTELPPMTPEPIEAVLEALHDEPGGVHGYLARWGVDAARSDRLAEVMLEARGRPSRPASS